MITSEGSGGSGNSSQRGGRAPYFIGRSTGDRGASARSREKETRTRTTSAPASRNRSAMRLERSWTVAAACGASGMASTPFCRSIKIKAVVFASSCIEISSVVKILHDQEYEGILMYHQNMRIDS